MMKNYVPPRCPMHMFLQKYTRLQFDRESEENYEEKRARIGRPLMRANLAVERHASKIYTRAMFATVWPHQVEEVEKHETYVAIHSEAESQRRVRSGAGYRTRLQCFMRGMNSSASVASLHTWACCAAMCSSFVKINNRKALSGVAQVK